MAGNRNGCARARPIRPFVDENAVMRRTLLRRTLGRFRDRSAPPLERRPPPADLPTPTGCVACGGSLPEAPPPSLPPVLLDCLRCGTGTTWPPPERHAASDEIWQALYGSTRLRRRDTWLREGLLRVEWMRTFVPPGATILEVGSGTGEFVKVAADQGFDAYGVEPSHWAVERAREIGARVDAAFLSEWSELRPGIRPELVALWHTVEHLPDPVHVLSEARELLMTGGIVLIEVPNYASPEAKRLGVAWDGAQPNEHHFQFTPEGLAQLLARAGFESIELTPLTQEPYLRPDVWRQQERDAVAARRPWPTAELLRASATRA